MPEAVREVGHVVEEEAANREERERLLQQPQRRSSRRAVLEAGEEKEGRHRDRIHAVSYTHLTLPTICSV
eukprot:3905104-Prymnesium_polylepis.1